MPPRINRDFDPMKNPPNQDASESTVSALINILRQQEDTNRVAVHRLRTELNTEIAKNIKLTAQLDTNKSSYEAALKAMKAINRNMQDKLDKMANKSDTEKILASESKEKFCGGQEVESSHSHKPLLDPLAHLIAAKQPASNVHDYQTTHATARLALDDSKCDEGKAEDFGQLAAERLIVKEYETESEDSDFVWRLPKTSSDSNHALRPSESDISDPIADKETGFKQTEEATECEETDTKDFMSKKNLTSEDTGTTDNSASDYIGVENNEISKIPTSDFAGPENTEDDAVATSETVSEAEHADEIANKTTDMNVAEVTVTHNIIPEQFGEQGKDDIETTQLEKSSDQDSTVQVHTRTNPDGEAPATVLKVANDVNVDAPKSSVTSSEMSKTPMSDRKGTLWVMSDVHGTITILTFI